MFVAIEASELILVTVKNVPLTSTVLLLGPALVTVAAAPLASVQTMVNVLPELLPVDVKVIVCAFTKSPTSITKLCAVPEAETIEV